MDPVISNASSLLLACVFAGAALHKWRHAGEFRQVLADYRIAPAVSVATLAWLLPVTESIAAAGLIVPATRLPAAGLSIVLLLVYSVAIGINLLRGRRTLDCGCGGPRQSLSEWLLLRNALLLVLAFAAGAERIERELGVSDWGITLLAAAAGVLCYLTVNQLLANGDALNLPGGNHA